MTFVVSSRQFNQNIKRISNTKRDDTKKIMLYSTVSTYWNADFDFHKILIKFLVNFEEHLTKLVRTGFSKIYLVHKVFDRLHSE